jgi:hypothetical protein
MLHAARRTDTTTVIFAFRFSQFRERALKKEARGGGTVARYHDLSRPSTVGHVRSVSILPATPIHTGRPKLCCKDRTGTVG